MLLHNFEIYREESGNPKFKAVFIRRDVVDSDGAICNPEAAAAQLENPMYLYRQHPKMHNRMPISLGAGVIRQTANEVYLEGELHNTDMAREFATEYDGLQKYNLGACSVGMRIVKARRGAQLTHRERSLGAQVVYDKVFINDVSFVDFPGMQGSDFALYRSLEKAEDEKCDIINRTREQERVLTEIVRNQAEREARLRQAGFNNGNS